VPMYTNYQDTIGCAAGHVSAKSKTAPLFRSQGTSSQELVCSRVLRGCWAVHVHTYLGSGFAVLQVRGEPLCG